MCPAVRDEFPCCPTGVVDTPGSFEFGTGGLDGRITEVGSGAGRDKPVDINEPRYRRSQMTHSAQGHASGQ